MAAVDPRPAFVAHVPEMRCLGDRLAHALAEKRADMGHGDGKTLLADAFDSLCRQSGAQTFLCFPMKRIDVEGHGGVSRFLPASDAGDLDIGKAEPVEIGAREGAYFLVERAAQIAEPGKTDRLLRKAPEASKDGKLGFQCLQLGIGNGVGLPGWAIREEVIRHGSRLYRSQRGAESAARNSGRIKK